MVIQDIKIEYVPISQLKPAEYNPRKASDKEHKDLKKSMETFGLVDPIIVNSFEDRKNIIIGGHFRCRVAKELGYKDVPVTYVKISDINKEKELNVRLNKNSGDFDMELLANFDEDMLLDIGFDSAELDKIFQLEPEAKDDEIPEDVPATTVMGDIYQLGEHRLLCGDSTNVDDVERLMDGKKADMVFTDPPYGISVVKNRNIGGGGAFGGKKNFNGKNNIKANSYSEVLGDGDTSIAKDVYSLCISLKFNKQIIWGGNYFTDFLPPSRGWIAWDKIDGVEGTTKNFSDIELAWTTFDKPARIFRHRWQGLLKASEHKEKRIHPTQKPIALAVECFGYYEAGQTIVDFFLGSGSTLIACEKTNRICYGMELDPKYCDVIVKRWEDYTGKKAVRNGKS